MANWSFKVGMRTGHLGSVVAIKSSDLNITPQRHKDGYLARRTKISFSTARLD